MEWIAGFAWALPRAFAAAVSACRFELGDVLVRERADTGRWSASRPLSGPILQVLDPPRSTRAISADAEGSRFETHWGSPVTLERFEPGSAIPVRVETTQGRLYSCLWRGALELLDPATPERTPPRPLRDLQRQLSHAVPAFRARFAKKRKLRGGEHQLFVFASDDAIELSRVKADGMESLLAEVFETESCTLDPAQAGVPDADAFRPSLRLCGIAIATPDAAAVEGCLAGLLYGGASGSATRFSLARHGHLTGLTPSPTPAPAD